MNRYQNIPIIKNSEGTRYYRDNKYPRIPLSVNDIYVITTVGDRLDYLAYTYYRDSELYWIISAANNNITKGALYPVPGTQLRIPTDINSVLDLYNQFNQAR
jgi:hypothetical protein